MRIFGTGHRPEHCGLSYEQMFELAKAALSDHSPSDTILCGMASGWDLALGRIAMIMEFNVWTVRPWAGHRPRVSEISMYEALESYAQRHVITNDSLFYPGPWCYQIRNEWMVDNGDQGLALWNGKESGGTYNCIKYAEKKGKPVVNIWRNYDQTYISEEI